MGQWLYAPPQARLSDGRPPSERAGLNAKDTDQLTPEHIRQYQLYLTRDRQVSWPYFNQVVCALRFFYRHVLKKDWAVAQIPYQRTGRKLPEILSPQEVTALFRATPNLKHRALLMTNPTFSRIAGSRAVVLQARWRDARKSPLIMSPTRESR